MQLLYVNPNADLYGASKVLLRLIQSLKTEEPQSYEFVVVVPEEGVLSDALRSENVTVKVMPYMSVVRRRVFRTWRVALFVFFLIPSIVYLGWLILREQIDLVHTNTGVVLPSAIAAFITRRPHVWHMHEMFSEEFPLLWKYYSFLILFLSDRVVCVSKYIAQQFSYNSKVQVVTNGLDTKKNSVDNAKVVTWRSSLLDSGYSYLVGVVGRISPRKGQRTFLEACVQIKNEGYSNIRYLIVGDAFAGNEALMDQLKSFVIQHNLSKDVKFIGFIVEPEPLIAALDILVLPSVLPEAFPTIVLEAMSLGVPVIATNLGGVTEQIKDGYSGLLVPAGEADAIASAIKCLINDAEKRRKLGQAGKHCVESCFSLSSMSLQVHNIYQELCRGE